MKVSLSLLAAVLLGLAASPGEGVAQSRRSRPSFSRSSSFRARASYSRASYSRPSYSRARFSRPSYSRPSYRRPTPSTFRFTRPSPSYTRARPVRASSPVRRTVRTFSAPARRAPQRREAVRTTGRGFRRYDPASGFVPRYQFPPLIGGSTPTTRFDNAAAAASPVSPRPTPPPWQSPTPVPWTPLQVPQLPWVMPPGPEGSSGQGSSGTNAPPTNPDGRRVRVIRVPYGNSSGSSSNNGTASQPGNGPGGGNGSRVGYNDNYRPRR